MEFGGLETVRNGLAVDQQPSFESERITEQSPDLEHFPADVQAALLSAWELFVPLQDAFFEGQHAKISAGIAHAENIITDSGEHPKIIELAFRYFHHNRLTAYTSLTQQTTRPRDERLGWLQRSFEAHAPVAVGRAKMEIENQTMPSKDSANTDTSTHAEPVTIPMVLIPGMLEIMKERIFDNKARTYDFEIKDLDMEARDALKEAYDTETGYLIVMGLMSDRTSRRSRLAAFLRRDTRTEKELIEEAYKTNEQLKREREKIYYEAYQRAYQHYQSQQPQEEQQSRTDWSDMLGSEDPTEFYREAVRKTQEAEPPRFYGVGVTPEQAEIISNLSVHALLNELETIVRSGNEDAAKKYAKNIRTQYHPDREGAPAAETGISQVVGQAIDTMMQRFSH